MRKRKIIVTAMLITLCFITGLFSLQSNIIRIGNHNSDSPTRGKNVIASVPKPTLPVTLVTNREASIIRQNTNATSNVNQTDSAVQQQTQQIAQASPAPTRTDNTVSRGSTTRTISMVATGYTDAPEENYPYAGQPSYIGLPLARGIVAVDPNVIPMGTKLYVEGYGEAIAADQGGAIKGNRIDLFFDSKWEANTWGIKPVRVTVYR